MSTFVLVHGAFHGAWCWERLVPELEARGHETVAMDLPCEDGSATFETYAGVVLAATRDVDDGFVVVGHSLGAMTIPLVAAARAVETLVFLCPVIPNFSGMPWDDAPPMEAPGAFDAVVRHEDGTMTLPSADVARDVFYHDCSVEDAQWAFERLRTQNSTSLWATPYPLSRWPESRKVAIACTDDRVVTAEHLRKVCPERLGVEPIELPGDHSPFLSRPGELAEVLARVVLAPP